MGNIRKWFIGLTGFILYTILLTGLSRMVFRDYIKTEEKIGSFIPGAIYASSEILKTSMAVFEKDQFLVENSTNKDGFEYHEPIDYELKLLLSYKTARNVDVIELLDVKTGNCIKKWMPDSKKIDKLSYNPDNPRKAEKTSDLNLRHPLMLSDSSIIICSEHSLMRIGPDNSIMWLNNEIEAHHSIEQNLQGEIIVTGRKSRSNKYDFLPFDKEDYETYLYDDTIDKVDPETGKLIWSKAIIEILVENDYEYLLTRDGFIIEDPIHLNDIQPASYATEYWEEEDLLISCRHPSLVFQYRPSTNKVIWLQQGPWYNQHDADFLDSSKIVVYDNNIFQFERTHDWGINEWNSGCYGPNDVYVVDLSNNQITPPLFEGICR